MAEVVPKMARRKGSNMRDNPERDELLDLQKDVCRHFKKNSSILSCIGKTKKEGCTNVSPSSVARRKGGYWPKEKNKKEGETRFQRTYTVC